MITFNGKQHLGFGLFTLTNIYATKFYLLGFSWSNIDTVFVLACLGGSLFPDVDHKNSIAGYIIPAWLIFRHGTVTHTLLFSFIFLGIALGSKSSAFFGFWVGIITHLVADNLSGNNLKYLYYPFKRRRKRR